MSAPRGDAITPFFAMEVMKAANARAAAGDDVLHMEVGEPMGGAPAKVLAAAKKILHSGTGLGYTEALGIPELRARIARYYLETAGASVDPGRIVVTGGSSAAFLLSFLAAFGDGARVGLAEPGYPAYRNIAAALGFDPVGIPTGADTRYQPTRAHLERALPLDGLVVASPANPTGTMLTPGELEDIAAWCGEHGVQLVSDEVYHGITYDAPARTIAAIDSGAWVVNSFSKYFGMTGWRLGWMVVPEEAVRSIECLAQNLYISPSALSQHAAVTAFDCAEELDARVAAYARNRALLLDALPRAGFDQLAPADGAFYIFADVSALTDDSTAFCRRMLDETGVAATPGVDFDPVRGGRFLRFSLAGSEADMAEAARRLTAWRGGT